MRGKEHLPFCQALDTKYDNKTLYLTLRQYRMIWQERMAGKFSSEKGVKTQEYFVCFKFSQRIYGENSRSYAADAIVR